MNQWVNVQDAVGRFPVVKLDVRKAPLGQLGQTRRTGEREANIGLAASIVGRHGDHAPTRLAGSGDRSSGTS